MNKYTGELKLLKVLELAFGKYNFKNDVNRHQRVVAKIALLSCSEVLYGDL